MVLQRDRKPPVWVHAIPGAKVQIFLLHKTTTALANQEGKWSAKSAPRVTSRFGLGIVAEKTTPAKPIPPSSPSVSHQP